MVVEVPVLRKTCMIRPHSRLSCSFLGGLLALIVLTTQVAAGNRIRARVPSPLAFPSVIALIPREGPLGLPGLLTSTDVVIGDPTVSYIDPEFLPDERLMVWQDAAGDVWLCQVDSKTGAMIPPDGKGEYAGRAAPLLTKETPFVNVTYNGPEFGISRQGIVVYYCGSERLEIIRYDLATKQMVIPVPSGTQNTRALITSKQADDPGVRVISARFAQASGTQIPTVVNEWFDDSSPDVVHAMPHIKSGTSGPQWLPGERALITQYADQNGVQQVSRYDLDTQEFTQLTTTPGDKIDSFAFTAPEFPGETLFLTLNQRKWLEVYRQLGDSWVRIQRIPAPGTSSASSSGLKSAEPLIFRGKTYFTYLADGEEISRIAFASLDGQINTWISKSGQLDQYDPEGVAFEDRLFVYYYEGVNAQNIQRLHRCELHFW